ncbi:hypothetical protein Tco_0638084 [Tanacetum coccineum]
MSCILRKLSTATKDEDKSKGKRLKDVPVVQEFPKVFLEDLRGKIPRPSVLAVECRGTNPCLTLRKRNFIADCISSKKGFGRCVDAKRKGIKYEANIAGKELRVLRLRNFVITPGRRNVVATALSKK